METASVTVGRLVVRMAWGATPASSLLASLLGEPVTFRHACPACGSDHHGRPIATLQDGRSVAVSVAHAGDMSLVAWIDGGQVGVDLEPVDAPPPPGIRHPDDPSDVDDLTLWVLKEAYLKASGDGLRRAPATVGPREPGAERGMIGIDGHVAAWCLLSRPEAASAV